MNIAYGKQCRIVNFIGKFELLRSFCHWRVKIQRYIGESGDAIGTVEPTGSYTYGSMVPIASPLSLLPLNL